jgi:F-type H+-transporting ATPase subunit b
MSFYWNLLKDIVDRGLMISIDWTIIATGIVFLLTLLALNSILFKPLLRVMDERDSLTRGAMEKAEENRSALSELVDSYGESIKAARQKGYETVDSVRKAATARRMEMIAEAREGATAEMQKVRGRVSEEVEIARKELQSEVEAIADSITAKILSKS